MTDSKQNKQFSETSVTGCNAFSRPCLTKTVSLIFMYIFISSAGGCDAEYAYTRRHRGSLFLLDQIGK